MNEVEITPEFTHSCAKCYPPRFLRIRSRTRIFPLVVSNSTQNPICWTELRKFCPVHRQAATLLELLSFPVSPAEHLMRTKDIHPLPSSSLRVCSPARRAARHRTQPDRRCGQPYCHRDDVNRVPLQCRERLSH